MICPSCDGILNATGCQACGWKTGDPWPAHRLVGGTAHPLKDRSMYPPPSGSTNVAVVIEGPKSEGPVIAAVLPAVAKPAPLVPPVKPVPALPVPPPRTPVHPPPAVILSAAEIGAKKRAEAAMKEKPKSIQ